MPKGTPAHVSKRLGSAVVEALSDPAVQKRIAEIGQEVVPPAHQMPQALAAHHKSMRIAVQQPRSLILPLRRSHRHIARLNSGTSR